MSLSIFKKANRHMITLVGYRTAIFASEILS